MINKLPILLVVKSLEALTGPEVLIRFKSFIPENERNPGQEAK